MVVLSLSFCTLYIASVVWKFLLSSQQIYNEMLGDKSHCTSNHHFRHKLDNSLHCNHFKTFIINITQSMVTRLTFSRTLLSSVSSSIALLL